MIRKFNFKNIIINKVLLIIIFIHFILYLINCIDFSEYGESIKPVRKITDIDGEIFFGKVWSMAYADGHLFLSERDNNQILEIDISSVPKLINIYGRPGQGPGELLENSYINVQKGYLYIQELSGMTVYNINDKSYCNRKTLKSARIGSLEQWGVDAEQGIFYGYNVAREKNRTIVSVDRNDSSLNTFGGFLPVNKNRSKYMANHRMVTLSPKGEVLSVSQEQAVIEKYTKSGRLLSKLDLRETNLIVKNTNNTQAIIYKKDYFSKGSKNVGFANVRHIDMAGDTLYILFNGYDYKGYRNIFDRKLTEYIITVDVKDDKMKGIKTFSFPKKDFGAGAFCVISTEKIAVYNNSTGEVEIYRLNF